ncbi:hypothetical protein PCE1_003286 [Barthelona sp. PCE]
MSHIDLSTYPQGTYILEPGISFVIPLREFRKTDSVSFCGLSSTPNFHVDGIDRVEHIGHAQSPGCIEKCDGTKIDACNTFYMHPNQIDQLLVFSGRRTSNLWNPKFSKEIFSYTVTPNQIIQNVNGEERVIHDGPAILGWFNHVYHQVISEDGSLSVNFATRTDEFDLKHEFDIFVVDAEAGTSEIVREGHLDQF